MQWCCRVLWARANLRYQKDSENACCTQMSPHFNLFLGKMDFEFSVPKTKGTIQTFISDRSKSKCLSWYGGCSKANGMGDWHMCKGTIDMEAYTGIVQRYILPSRWCLSWEVHGHYIKTMSALILHMLQQRGFVDRSKCARLASRSVSYWKCMAHHEKENQTTTITDCWASEVLYQARLDKIFGCRTLTISILNS